jgi:hypothetical protein
MSAHSRALDCYVHTACPLDNGTADPWYTCELKSVHHYAACVRSIVLSLTS